MARNAGGRLNKDRTQWEINTKPSPFSLHQWPLRIMSVTTQLSQENSHLQVEVILCRVQIKEQWRISLFKSFPPGFKLGLNSSFVRPSHMQNSPHPSAGLTQKMKDTHECMVCAHKSRTHRHGCTARARTRKAWRGIRGAIHYAEKSPHWTVQRPRQGNNQHQCVLARTRVCVCMCVYARGDSFDESAGVYMWLCPPPLLNDCKLRGCNFLSAARSLCPLMCRWIGSSSAVMRVCNCISSAGVFQLGVVCANVLTQ